MEDLESLKRRVRDGDLQALQELRDRGYFSRNTASESKSVATGPVRAPLS